jgi:hypothetical protein
MATTQPVALTLTFDGAGAPLALTVTSQLTLAGQPPVTLPPVTYPLDAADKAALLALWNKAKAALGFP